MNKIPTLERLMLNYKKSGDNYLFEQIIKHPEMKTFIAGVAGHYGKFTSYTNYSEDLRQVAELTLWQALMKFKFICPCCGLKALTEDGFKKHCTERHGKKLQPKNSILAFVRYQCGAYIQNELRKEKNEQEKIESIQCENNEGIEKDTHFYGDAGHKLLDAIVERSKDFTEDVETVMLVQQMSADLDDVAKEILMDIIDSNTASDIAKKFHEQGLYSTLQSARVSVNRKINKILKGKLRPILQI